MLGGSNFLKYLLTQLTDRKISKYNMYGINENDRILVFGNTTLEVIIMQLQTMQILFKINYFTQLITSIKFSSNQQNFALGFNNGSIFLYSYNYQNLDPIAQFNDKDFQLDLTKAPLCIKVFGRNSSLLAQQCKSNKNTKIFTTEMTSLIEIFKQLGAIESN